MNTAIRTETGEFSGIGFALPSDTVTLIAGRIVSGESLDMAFLGVGIESAQADIVGAIIIEVEDGLPADEAGLRPGDIVVRIGSVAITERRDLAANVRLRSPGETVELEFARDGEFFVVEVTLGEG